MCSHRRWVQPGTTQPPSRCSIEGAEAVVDGAQPARQGDEGAVGFEHGAQVGVAGQVAADTVGHQVALVPPGGAGGGVDVEQNLVPVARPPMGRAGPDR